MYGAHSTIVPERGPNLGPTSSEAVRFVAFFIKLSSPDFALVCPFLRGKLSRERCMYNTGQSSGADRNLFRETLLFY